ncbi:MAG: ETC complex I subunit [Alphaproteobacteria bacterium]|nr:ETC complex I subunit [Alphaproteobacteria bacterium]
MTTKARIFQPSKTAMQSGRAKTSFWLFEYDPTPKQIDPLMGWTGSTDTLGQLRLRFPSQEAAIAFAEEKNIPFEVDAPHQPNHILKSYSDNFSFNAIETYVPAKKTGN